MSDPHHDDHGHPQDPNVAPTHQEIVGDFSSATVFIATILGLIAAAAGIIAGIVLTNDKL